MPGSGDDTQAFAFQGERAALRSFYGAKIEATRSSLPASEIGAAIRAIIAEQRAAFRALAGRRQAAQAAARDLRAVNSAGEVEGQRLARPPPLTGPLI